jgi:hypothetical protein
MLEDAEDQALSTWRENRERGWYRDIGYRIQSEMGRHYYDTRSKGAKPDDPGWHACRCGWEGYWSGYDSHVADHLRALVVATDEESQDPPS